MQSEYIGCNPLPKLGFDWLGLTYGSTDLIDAQLGLQILQVERDMLPVDIA